jgi:HNH endonuclease
MTEHMVRETAAQVKGVSASCVRRFRKYFREGAPGECWEWFGSRLPNGYGRLGDAGRTVYAHRLSYQLYVGEIANGLCVCHRCDNPRCVNPNHLFIGSQAENIADRDAKGRHRVLRGEAIPGTRLTEAQVVEIRRLYIPRSRQTGSRALARRFGVSQGAVSAAINGDTWRHVGGMQ